MMADNMSVVKNTSIPESVLKKKSNSIAYHYVRERAASGSILVRHERTDSNIADILTKIQPHSVRERLLRLFMHRQAYPTVGLLYGEELGEPPMK